jgi:hypothetical protein
MLLHTNVYHLEVTVGFPTVARLCVFEPTVPTLKYLYREQLTDRKGLLNIEGSCT